MFMKKLIAGNWKMNGSVSSSTDLINSVAEKLKQNAKLLSVADFAVFPCYLHLEQIKNIINDCNAPIKFGGQDCSENDNGAFTGDVSATMLKDFGADYVILGHSERREYHNESSELIGKKASFAHSKELVTIICVGEKENEREQGNERQVAQDQLIKSMPESCNSTNTVIAYEPVWAIGTGKTATPDDVAQMHSFIRSFLRARFSTGQDIKILYGGSVKPSNAKELFQVPDVNGALIGGASLKADDYIAIAEALL